MGRDRGHRGHGHGTQGVLSLPQAPSTSPSNPPPPAPELSWAPGSHLRTLDQPPTRDLKHLAHPSLVGGGGVLPCGGLHPTRKLGLHKFREFLQALQS